MRRLLAVAFVLPLLACARTAPGLPDVALPTLAGGETKLSSCSAPKCLTVYVAPWCGYCRAATPAIRTLRVYLADKGVATRVVVGMDQLDALREYAKDFGPDTMLDSGRALAVGGVPHFYVTDASGRLIKEVAGMPSGDVDTPRLAAFFGLP